MLIIVKLMGKHRGLPSNTDAALDGQYHRIHSLLIHLEAQARHRLGQGDAPELPDWVKETYAPPKSGANGSSELVQARPSAAAGGGTPPQPRGPCEAPSCGE